MQKIKRNIARSLIFALIISLVPMNFSLEDPVGYAAPATIHIESESTYPENNILGVEVNPLIKFNFKEKIKIKDKSKIKISSDAGVFAVDFENDISLSGKKTTLKIDINSKQRKGVYNLRKNTAYKITLEEGALELTGSNGQSALNKQEFLYFITGEEETKGLVAEKYSSSDKFYDDIRSTSNTQLNSDGNIYIKFNHEIEWNEDEEGIKDGNDALKHFILYEKPELKENKYYSYKIDKQPVDVKKKVDIANVDIIKDNSGKKTILQITPKEALRNLNEYQIKLLKKEILISTNNKFVLKDEISTSIWTKSLDDNTVPEWKTALLAKDIKKDNKVPTENAYVIHGAPNYNSSKPIILYVKGEVIVRPQIIGSLPLVLSGVKLYESHKDSKIDMNLEVIRNYKLEYVYDINGILEKTKISISPDQTLNSGKEYKLDIAKGTFVTRGNKELEDINLRFVIEGDREKVTEIYKTEVHINDKKTENTINTLFDYHLKKENNKFKNEVSLKLKGYNFTEDIKEVRLVKKNNIQNTPDIKIPKFESSSMPGVTDKEKIIFSSVNEIIVKLGEKDLEKFLDVVNLGEYDIRIIFNNRTEIAESSSEYKESIFINKQRICDKPPKVLSIYPDKGQKGINHNKLNEVIIEFEDKYDDLEVNTYEKDQYGKYIFDENGNPVIALRKVVADTFSIKDESDNDIIDRSKRIIVVKKDGKTIFKIPVSHKGDNKIKDGKRYKVNVPEGLVKCKNGKGIASEAIEWIFDTIPLGIGDLVYEGSVPEDYNADYPIVIHGKDLTSRTKVIFYHLGREKEFYTELNPTYLQDPTGATNSGKLFVYLPKINRLPVGLYNIILKTDDKLEDNFVYGTFSVVEKGQNVPSETDRDQENTDDNVENVKELIATSKNTMELRIGYRGNTLKLDEIVGEDALTREIKFKGGSLSSLNTVSKWSNTSLTDLKKISPDFDMNIRLGRAEPNVQDIVKKKLKGYIVKSDFIIVGGENYTARKLRLTIPYNNSNGIGLKLMKYDEDTRRVSEVSFPKNNIDMKNKTINIEINNISTNSKDTKGVFVVVEQGI